jgi:hypothetical protein
MVMSIDELIAAILRLPPEDLARVHRALNSVHAAATNAVRDGAATHQGEPRGASMTYVTVVLPDDLAEQARNTGLLASKSLEDILRRELQAHCEGVAPSGQRYRRLVEKNGYLVAEALPGERPITTEEVKKILDDMDW